MNLPTSRAGKKIKSNAIYSALKGKKIVMLVVNNFTHDSRVLKEALSAKQAGLKVTVLARKSANTPFGETKDGIRILRLQTVLDKLWSKISKNGGREIAGSQSAGMPKSLAVYAGIVNTYLINHLFIRELKKIKPDLVHVNDATALLAGLFAKKMGAKVVYDSHELYTEQLANPNKIWQKYFTRLEKKLPSLDAVFSVNQSILDELDRRYHIDRLPQAILYNAPFLEKIPEKKPAREIKLLYLGHYQADRGLEELFKAVSKMAGVSLTTFGNGFIMSDDKKIIHLAPVKPEEVVKVASEYDIGILPYIGDSLNNRYSTPNKIFEYMMAGLAIAASDLPEIRKIIRENRNGELFNPKRSASIANAINRIIQDKRKLKQYQHNSLAAAQKYAWEEQEKKQLEIYSQLINSP